MIRYTNRAIAICYGFYFWKEMKEWLKALNIIEKFLFDRLGTMKSSDDNYLLGALPRDNAIHFFIFYNRHYYVFIDNKKSDDDTRYVLDSYQAHNKWLKYKRFCRKRFEEYFKYEKFINMYLDMKERDTCEREFYIDSVTETDNKRTYTYAKKESEINGIRDYGNDNI